MMKIFNWIGGGFFRTIGRFVAFIALGAIFSLAISKSHISITDLLGIDTVKAVTITQEVDQNGYTVIEQNTTNYALDGERFTINVQPSETVQSFMFSAKLNNSNLSGKDYVEIPLMVALPANYVVGETQGTGVVCSYWLQNTNGTWACGQFINVQSMTPVEHTGLFSVFNIGANVILEDNSKAYCTIQNNSLVCPIYKKKVKELWFEVLYRSNNLGDLKIAFDRNWMYYMKVNETQTIVDSIENQTQQQIESQQVCQYIDKNDILTDKYFLTNNGNLYSAVNYGVTDYIIINKAEIKVTVSQQANNIYSCFYNSNKELISCITNEFNENEIINIPQKAVYFRASIFKTGNRPQFNICKNGNQALNDYMTDINIDSTNSTATNFFNSFSDTDHGGLSSIITAPLNTINAMLSNTCVAPSATWQGATITLPCGDMFWNRPGADQLKNLLNVFYGGFVCYYAIRKLFLLIEQLKDPTQDRIEVMDL